MGRAYWQLDDVSWINRCYLWGEPTREWLMDTGIFIDDQLKVCGNPRLDIYRFPEVIQDTGHAGKAFTIGVAFSAKSTSTYFGKHSYAQAYFEMHPNLNFPITKLGRHYEDICWRDHAILRIMMRSIKGCIDRFPDCKIVLRPSPFEDPDAYRFLEQKLSGKISVEWGEPLPLFIGKIDMLLTCWSTTGLEALIGNKPVISIAGMMDQKHLFEHISKEASGFDTFVHLYEYPMSESGFYEIIKKIKDNKYSKSKHNIQLERLRLKELYDWPSEKSASSLIAEDIVTRVREAQKRPDYWNGLSDWKEIFPVPFNLPFVVVRILSVCLSQLKYLRSGAYKSYSSFFSLRDKKVNRLVGKYISECRLNEK